MSVVIRVEALQKQYGNNIVLKGISFTVNQGEIFALLGTNGAGKTTTLECMEGIRKYEQGQISVQGKIGVQLQSSSLPENMKVMEAVKLFAKWSKNPIDMDFMERLGLAAIKNKQYKEMSTGQKRRLHLALALVGNPDVIFLDEPTAGLDVEGRTALHHEIRGMKKQGKTIIMASHDMAEVEALCDRLVILKDGEIAFLGTVSELTAEIHATHKVHLKLSAPLEAESLSFSSYQGMVHEYYVFETNNIEDGLFELLTTVKEQGVHVHDVKIEQASLEQRFMDIAKKSGSGSSSTHDLLAKVSHVNPIGLVKEGEQ